MTAPIGHGPLRSLRIVAILSIAVPLTVYAIFGAFRYVQVRDEAAMRVSRSLRVAHEHALRVIEGVESLQDRVALLVDNIDPQELRHQQATLHTAFQRMIADKPQFQSIWVIAGDGTALATSRFETVPNLNFSDRSYFKFHQDHLGPRFLTEPLITRTTGEHILDVSLPRHNADRSFGGVISTSLFTSYFAKFHSDLVADEPGLAINMFHQSGAIYTRWPRLENAPTRLASDSPVMRALSDGLREGEIRGVSSVDGRDRLIAFRRVGDYPMFLGAGMDLTEVRYQFMREMGLLLSFGIPPVVALFWTVLIALRRTRESFASAEQLAQETQTRRKAEEALVQAQKLEALGRLTGGVAHDFNNALMVISNNLFLLKAKHPGVGAGHLDSIKRAVDSATKLTRQLLAFSRRQPLVPEVVRLQEMLPGIQELAEPVLGSQVGLAATVHPDTSPIRVDRAELELAFLNLAINAKDAMPAGGSFMLRARNAPVPLPPGLSGDFVVVEAIDTGEGIPADLLDKVFEPFFTTKPMGQGTGLGLSQVYGLCQRAGGTATLHSVPGKGTTVRMFFPAALGEAAVPPADGVPASSRQLNKSLLLAEDNDEVATGLVPVLEAMGCQVKRVPNAAAALAHLQGLSQLPDALVSDVVMPGEMDGVGLARAVRARYPAMGIVLMTGYASQMEAIATLGFEVLPKPCSADMLADAILRTTRPPPPA